MKFEEYIASLTEKQVNDLTRKQIWEAGYRCGLLKAQKDCKDAIDAVYGERSFNELWYVNFVNGYSDNHGRSNTHHVRLVRGEMK